MKPKSTTQSKEQPQNAASTLFLIKEELKSRKFFNTLRDLGLDDSHFQPSLDELIMTNLGLNDDQDRTFDFYYKIMEKYSEIIEPSLESIDAHARNAYFELTKKRKRSVRKK